MTLDEALKVAEEACQTLANEDNWLGRGNRVRNREAAAALARLREEIPKLHAIVAENLTRPRLEIVARLDAILARLEEGEGT